jgi:hypothetical protein
MSWLVNIMVYTVIALCTLGACLLILSQPHYPTYGIGHTMAVNLTKVNDTFCRIYWLGGTDYLSFIRDIRVGNVSIGHPEPGTMIYEGTECNMTVSMYFRDVKAYQTIWPEDKR